VGAMRRLVFLLVMVAVVIPSPVMAWGPRTHLHMAYELGADVEKDADFMIGTILPDLSLALRAAGHSEWPDLQSVTHSEAFLEVLPEGAFRDGWRAHLDADAVEYAYSRERMDAGAPYSADFPVDLVYEIEEMPEVVQRHVGLVRAAFDAVGVETPWIDSWDVDWIFSNYVHWVYREAYRPCLEEWYSDYEDYVDRSMDAMSWVEFAPEPEPEPRLVPVVKKHRPWMRYAAPPGRTENERKKRAIWQQYRARMSACKDRGEKARLYAEWGEIRDSMSMPSVRV